MTKFIVIIYIASFIFAFPNEVSILWGHEGETLLTEYGGQTQNSKQGYSERSSEGKTQATNTNRKDAGPAVWVTHSNR